MKATKRLHDLEQGLINTIENRAFLAPPYAPLSFEEYDIAG